MLQRLLKLLLGQRSLRQAVPDLDGLLADPAGRLAARAVTIRPPRLWWAALAALAANPAAGWLLFESWLAVWIGAGLGLVEALVFLLVLPPKVGTGVRLDRDGLELSRRGTVVRCPWALFAAPGSLLDESGLVVLVPIHPGAVEDIQTWRPDQPARQGDPDPRLLKIGPDATARFSGFFSVPAGALFALVRRLAQVLAAGTPQAAPGLAPVVRAAAAPAPLAPGAAGPALGAPVAGGWIELPVVGLIFPAECSDCAAPTNQVLEFAGGVRFGWLLRLAGGDWAVGLQVPVCAACARRYRTTRRRGIWLGLLIGLGLSLPFAVLGLGLDEIGRAMMVVLGLILGPLVGWVVASRLGLPVHLRRYRPIRRTVQARFKRPDFAGRIQRGAG